MDNLEVDEKYTENDEERAELEKKIDKLEEELESTARKFEHSVAWDTLQQIKKMTQKIWVAFFITLGLLFATNCIWIWLWNQYDYSSVTEYSATGINAIIDNSGNVIAQDIPDEQLQKILEILNNGDSESKNNEDTNKKE